MHSLGYDSMGNASHLLSEEDKIAVGSGKYERVAGDAICPNCGYPYKQHPDVQGALWLVRACWGLVKL